MYTVIWYALVHIFEDIKRHGSIFLCSAKLYEYAHIIFKMEYVKISKRRATATYETIEKVNAHINRNETLMRSINNK